MTTNLLITPDVKIYDLLKAYPQLEDKLIQIAPVFEKLKNPILRKTITKVTTLKQASVVGRVSLSILINELRSAVGQGNTELGEEKSTGRNKPEWASPDKIKYEYDAREDLESGVHPVNKVVKESSEMSENEVYLLVTPFTPAPLIDLLVSKGFEVYSEEESPAKVCTYIKR
ncbi:MAG TPA: DUF1858 domain-containing protein [Ignavibacteria bacterium]|nr:DUF1858 domain-containing protein [Ignavibacteria bacterium]